MNAPIFAPLSERPLLHARRAIKDLVPAASTSHIAEALARAMGFRTHAALLTATSAAPQWRQLDEAAFRQRLGELTGATIDAGATGRFFDQVDWPDESGVIETYSKGFPAARYVTPRARAWRNMIVLAVNEGLDRGLVTMEPDGNYWSPTAKEDARLHRAEARFVHEFVIDGDIPAMVSFSDGGFGELRVFLALWPTPRAAELIGAWGASFLCGRAEADGWVERRDGAHIQTPSRPSLACRRDVLDRLAALQVEPRCFADRGSFRM